MNEESDAIAALREWLLEKNPELTHVDEEANLFDLKLIDSINFVEYILIIEEMIDREIPVTPDLVQKTATLAEVRMHFLSPASTTSR